MQYDQHIQPEILLRKRPHTFRMRIRTACSLRHVIRTTGYQSQDNRESIQCVKVGLRISPMLILSLTHFETSQCEEADERRGRFE